MSYKRGRDLDGYQLDPNDNSFVSNWINVHSAPFLNFKLIFANDGYAPDGYATLEESNDREAVWSNGNVYPASAQFVGAYGLGPKGDPVDLSTTINSSLFVSAESPTVYTWNLTNTASAGWYRIKYIATASVVANVTVTYSWKTSS